MWKHQFRGKPDNASTSFCLSFFLFIFFLFPFLISSFFLFNIFVPIGIWTWNLLHPYPNPLPPWARPQGRNAVPHVQALSIACNNLLLLWMGFSLKLQWTDESYFCCVQYFHSVLLESALNLPQEHLQWLWLNIGCNLGCI